jgi:hypothetical protein
MNYFPEDVQHEIYKYKHQLEFNDVMSELVFSRINCAFNVTLSMAKTMTYLDHNGCVQPCINLSNINVFAHEILNVISQRKYFEHKLF